MSELDRSISDVESDIQQLHSSKKKVRVDQKRSINWSIPVVILVSIILVSQLDSLTHWVFGIPEETIQADIIVLLESADKKIQASGDDSGGYPEKLPSDLPRWLIGYKKTLAGYKINTKIEDVEMELIRRGTTVEINRL